MSGWNACTGTIDYQAPRMPRSSVARALVARGYFVRRQDEVRAPQGLGARIKSAHDVSQGERKETRKPAPLCIQARLR